jgi:hypothetical protein
MKKNIPWLAAAAITIMIFATIYGTVQQAQRNEADLPQVQIAEDTAASLNNFQSPAMLVSGHVNMATSLAPFTIIYSKTGQPLEGSGYLNNQLPTVPIGVLKAADNKLYHRVTWQPQANLRFAAVSVAADNYYVLSGRSMELVEQSELRTLQVAAFGLAVSLGILAIAYYIMSKQLPKKRHHTN